MIPYEELSAALERWRVKNGLPGTPPLFAEGSTMKRPAAAAPAPSYGSAPAYSAPSYGSAPAYAAPTPAPMPPAPAPAPARVPPPPSAETLDEDVGEFAEDDVLAEDPLDNEGPDFAMAFSGAPPAPAPASTSPRQVATLTDDDDRESTMIGGTDPGIVPPPEDEDEFNATEKTPV